MDVLGLPFGSWQDTVMVNMFMFSFQTDGALRNLHTNETWAWTSDLTKLPTNVIDALFAKLNTIIAATLSFVVLLSVTSLVIRVLVASGSLLVVCVAKFLSLFSSNFLTTNVIIQPYTWLSQRASLMEVSSIIIPVLIAILSFCTLRVNNEAESDKRIFRCGFHVVITQMRGLSASPFLCAHFVFVIIIYSLFEAAQISWNFWFYNKSTPQVQNELCG